MIPDSIFLILQIFLIAKILSNQETHSTFKEELLARWWTTRSVCWSRRHFVHFVAGHRVHGNFYAPLTITSVTLSLSYLFFMWTINSTDTSLTTSMQSQVRLNISVYPCQQISHLLDTEMLLDLDSLSRLCFVVSVLPELWNFTTASGCYYLDYLCGVWVQFF